MQQGIVVGALGRGIEDAVVPVYGQPALARTEPRIGRIIPEKGKPPVVPGTVRGNGQGLRFRKPRREGPVELVRRGDVIELPRPFQAWLVMPSSCPW